MSKAKQKETSKILKRLTEIDGHLIDKLTEQVMKPLSEFIDKAEEALRKGDIKKADRLQSRFRKRIKPIFDDLKLMFRI